MTNPPPGSHDPCLARFPARPPAAELAEAAAAGWLVEEWALAALITAADQATCGGDLDAVGRRRCAEALTACRGAGVRTLATRTGIGRGTGSHTAIPADIRTKHRLAALRAELRLARRTGGTRSPAAGAAQRALQRATRAARQQQRAERAVQLESQFLEAHDAAGFFQAFRGAHNPLPDCILGDPEALWQHFCDLLAPPAGGPVGPPPAAPEGLAISPGGNYGGAGGSPQPPAPHPLASALPDAPWGDAAGAEAGPTPPPGPPSA